MNRKVRLDLVVLEEDAFDVLGRFRRAAMEQARSPDEVRPATAESFNPLSWLR